MVTIACQHNLIYDAIKAFIVDVIWQCHHDHLSVMQSVSHIQSKAFIYKILLWKLSAYLTDMQTVWILCARQGPAVSVLSTIAAAVVIWNRCLERQAFAHLSGHIQRKPTVNLLHQIAIELQMHHMVIHITFQSLTWYTCLNLKCFLPVQFVHAIRSKHNLNYSTMFIILSRLL